MFETRPRTVMDLEQGIQDEVAAIPVEMLREVMNSCRSRLEERVRRKEAILRALLSKHKFSNWH